MTTSKPRKCIAQLSLRSLKLVQLRGIRRRFVGIKLDASDARARIRNFHKRRLLEISRARNGVHEIRNQICAPLIHILHLRPTLIDSFVANGQDDYSCRRLQVQRRRQ